MSHLLHAAQNISCYFQRASMEVFLCKIETWGQELYLKCSLVSVQRAQERRVGCDVGTCTTAGSCEQLHRGGAKRGWLEAA